MTREEAIAVLHRTPWNPKFAETMDAIECQKFVAGLAALGVLQFDEGNDQRAEPEGQIGKVRKFMRSFHLQNFTPSQFYGALDVAGLKIVEK